MQEGFVNFNGQNFDPNTLANMTATVIQSVVVLDVSPSIRSYVNEMNTATTEVFFEELKNSHRKDDIVLQCISFNEKVEFKSGFQPITSLDADYLHVHPSGNGTALYDAVLAALNSVKSYREDLEAQGVEVRTNIFILTDGQDNSSSRNAASEVRNFVESLRSNEAWISTFTLSMFGIGDDSSFRASCIEMGLDPDKCLSTVGTSAKEIREMMGVVSKSASSSASVSGATF